MYQGKNFSERASIFIKLLLPVLVYQVISYSSGMIGTFMAGHYSPTDLAGVSMGVNIWNPIMYTLNAIVLALIPIVSQLIGKNKEEEIPTVVRQFLYIAVIISIILIIGLNTLATPIVDRLGMDSNIAEITKNYLFYESFGVLSIFLYVVLRSFIDSLGLTRLSMIMMIVSVPVNVFFAYSFIFGKFGMPELGGAGAGLGTSLAYWVLLGISILVLFKQERLKALHLEKRIPLNIDKIKEGVRLGLPIGGTVFAEVAIFSVVGLIMAKFSSLIIASHQSAMNFSSLMYAFPMSISSAMAIVVSYEVGAKRFEDAKIYARLGRITALIFAGFTLSFLYIFRDRVASLYGNDPQFIETTAVFLTYSLFFQLADTFAAPLQGILRGYKDTIVPFYLGLIGYWGVAIPLGYLLDQATDLGAFAYWIGLIASLIVSGCLYQWRLKSIMKRLS